MARADRLERLDGQRLALEQDYAAAFVAALRRCAAGSWGLFDHNQDRHESRTWDATLTELRDLAEQVDRMRETLGLPGFAMHHEFEAARGPVASSAPGEPKQAKAWLARMGEPID